MNQKLMKAYVSNVLKENINADVYAVEFNSDLAELPIPEEDKSVIDIFTENLLSKFAVEVSPRQWTIFDKNPGRDNDMFLTHDLTRDEWIGCGPNEIDRAFGAFNLGRGEKGRASAYRFAKKYGKSGGRLANMFGYV